MAARQVLAAAGASERIQVRLLGTFQVTRTDGSQVTANEWRTTKTADLLCLLAMRAEEYVPVEVILDALWPMVEQKRGRGSLRTAASQLRRVLGTDCLHRGHDGLMLDEVWVDAKSFSEKAIHAAQRLQLGDLAGSAAISREAIELYAGDFMPSRGDEDWAGSARRTLAASHLRLVLDAADTAITLQRPHEAAELAARGLLLDPYSERATRALMRAYVGQGELSRAVREFERCRQLLARELGTDPSADTRSLHLSLLTAAPDVAAQDAAVSIGGLESRLCAELEAADQAADAERGAEARLRLAAKILIPRRQFSRARFMTTQAAQLTARPEITARAIATQWLPEVLLGNAHRAEAPLRQAEALAALGDDRMVREQLAAMRSLVAHDLGKVVTALPGTVGTELWGTTAAAESLWAWVETRTSAELGDHHANPSGPGPAGRAGGHRFDDQLRRLATASMLVRSGYHEQAIEELQSVLDIEASCRRTLLVPETLAWLVISEAVSDLAAANEDFERLEEVLGARHTFPRESFLRLLARAAILAADGQFHKAAVAAASAAEAADRASLMHLSAQARHACGEYLAQAGARSKARRTRRPLDAWRAMTTYVGAWVSSHLGDAFWDLPLEAIQA